jgi:hypothetical protein
MAHRSTVERVRCQESTWRVRPVFSLPSSPMQVLDATNVYIVVTSAVFVDCWRARVPHLIGPLLDLGFVIYLYAGVQAELQVVVAHPDGTYTTAVATTGVGVGAFVAITAEWIHGARLWVGRVTVTVQVRRIAGAGDVLAPQPVRYMVRDPELGDTAPVWTLV